MVTVCVYLKHFFLSSSVVHFPGCGGGGVKPNNYNMATTTTTTTRTTIKSVTESIQPTHPPPPRHRGFFCSVPICTEQKQMGWQFCQIDKTRENAKKRVIVLVKDPFLFTGGGGTILLLYFLGYVFIFCRDTTKMVRYGNAEAQQNQYQYPRAHEKEQWSFLFFFVFLLWETIVMRLVKTIIMMI